MKKPMLFFLIMIYTVVLSACGSPVEETAAPESTCAEATICSTLPAPTPTTVPTIPATVPTTESTATPTQSLHSELYIDGVSVEDVILYFKEVCLNAEYVNSGDPSKLQKWTSPIYYILYGEYTQEDYYVLTDFMAWLNTIEGFPGIWQTHDPSKASMRIYFCDRDTMVSLLGDTFIRSDGGVTFWYQDDKIQDAIICYRTDLDQQLRNSVILEEIYNGLGPILDTWLRDDSIIYAGFSMPQELSAMDELILKLLYHPQLLCGMDATQCEAVIRQLYY